MGTAGLSVPRSAPGVRRPLRAGVAQVPQFLPEQGTCASRSQREGAGGVEGGRRAQPDAPPALREAPAQTLVPPVGGTFIPLPSGDWESWKGPWLGERWQRGGPVASAQLC